MLNVIDLGLRQHSEVVSPYTQQFFLVCDNSISYFQFWLSFVGGTEQVTQTRSERSSLPLTCFHSSTATQRFTHFLTTSDSLNHREDHLPHQPKPSILLSQIDSTLKNFLFLGFTWGRVWLAASTIHKLSLIKSMLS